MRALRAKEKLLPWFVSARNGIPDESMARADSRVGKGISVQAAHRTVRESLPSYGSCYLNQDFIPIFQ